MKKTRKILVGALTLLMLASTTVSAVAAPVQTAPETTVVIEPRYAVTRSADCSLTIRGNKASITSAVRAVSGAKVEITTSLLLDGEVIQSWSTSGTTSALISKTVTVSKHGTYQAMTEFTVTASSGSDSDTMYSSESDY